MDEYQNEIREHGFEIEVVELTEQDAQRIGESVALFMEAS